MSPFRLIGAGSVALLLGAFLAFPSHGASPGDDAEARALRGQAWAFGQSESRNDAIWRKGVDARQVGKKKSAKGQEGSPDTSGAIERALKEAEKDNIRSSLGMSMGHEAGTWKVNPEQQHPDETMFRDRRHVVRGFANVRAGQDLNISVGPELILKDEQHGEEAATENQPDSAFGLGMRFKYDF